MKFSQTSFMEKNKKLILIILSAALIITAILSLMCGTVWIGPNELINIMSGNNATKAGRILIYVRAPRVAAAIVAGIALAASGAIIQTVFYNPLAGPNIIGVNAGAGFAVALFSVIAPAAIWLLPAAAFCGAFITMLLIYFIGKKTGSSKLTLVLAGVAVNSFLNGCTDLIHTLSDQAVLSSYMFKIGGLSGINSTVLKAASIAVFIAVAAAMLFSNELELLSLGSQTAKTLGLNVEKYRFIFMMLSSVLAGAAVSFAGLVGFVGLIVPHVARLMVGDEIRYLIPASALSGAVLMLLCDLISRVVAVPLEIPVGIILSFIGAPFFIALLLKRKRGVAND